MEVAISSIIFGSLFKQAMQHQQKQKQYSKTAGRC
jgi:hypothetical protein